MKVWQSLDSAMTYHDSINAGPCSVITLMGRYTIFFKEDKVSGDCCYLSLLCIDYVREHSLRSDIELALADSSWR